VGLVGKEKSMEARLLIVEDEERLRDAAEFSP